MNSIDLSNNKKVAYQMSILLLTTLLVSCAGVNKKVPFTTGEPLIDKALAAEEKKQQRKIENYNKQRNDYKIKQRERFDVIADNMDAKTFFSSLVVGTSLNMLVHENVSGNITVNLKQVTLLETLKAVRDMYGYDYMVADYGIQILPNTQQTEIFPINYINVNRYGESMLSVNSGDLRNSEESDSENNSSTNTTQSKSSQVKTNSTANFWQQLKNTLEMMLNGEKDSSVVVDSHAGLVIVNAKPMGLLQIKNYLSKAELSVKRQVLIEAKLLEVTLKDGFETGINWQKLITEGDPTYIGGYLKSRTIDNAASLSGSFSIPFKTKDFAGMVQLLEKQGDVKVLSNPRIATVNNQKAVIKVGSDEFFVTEVSNDSTTTGNNIQNSPEVTLTPFFSGIALDVTPQIAENQEIILHVHPKITEVKERIKNFKVSDTDFSLPLAYSTVRETDSIIKAKSGQVIVLGGLIQNKLSDEEAKIPGFGDVPLLGFLGKQKSKQIERSELVILLQPKIVETGLTEQEIESFNRKYQEFSKPADKTELYRGR